ncbi:MAG: ROK family protein [Xanthobacteraceae bacterium]
MSDQSVGQPVLSGHGSSRLPEVAVESYNVALKDDAGFIGDRASKGAFRAFIEQWRKPLREAGQDPFGDQAAEAVSKKRLDEVLLGADGEAAGVIQSAIESFAQELALVMRRFLKLKEWKEAERLIVGGGFSGSRIGQLAIGRVSVLLKADKMKVKVAPIRNDPDEAGLIGAVHLVPSWMFRAHDAILAVDIGGTNIRAGVVTLNLKRAPDLAKARVWKFELWRHGDEKLNRADAVEGLIDMLQRLIRRAEKEGLRLVPFIGIGCPGTIEADGIIVRGAQNLPGNWESSRFNLPATVAKAIPKIGDFDTVIVMHNDAVVQGLSELPSMQDIARWGVFTIGTGFGNALFTNRAD